MPLGSSDFVGSLFPPKIAHVLTSREHGLSSTSDYGCCSQFSAQVSKLTTHERRLRRCAFGCQKDPGNPQRVQFRTKLLSVFVEAGSDECAVYLLLVNQEGCSGDTDDMHGRAGFN